MSSPCYLPVAQDVEFRNGGFRRSTVLRSVFRTHRQGRIHLAADEYVLEQP